MKQTISTTLTHYRFDLDDEEQAADYSALCATLATDHELFRVYGSRNFPPEGRHEIETTHLFADQWNSETHRIHGWYENIVPNERIRIGYWVELTNELREALRNTVVCGFCGHQEPAQKGNVFCDQCLDSEYLKRTELHLTRMHRVDQGRETRAPLTPAEKAHLDPRYTERQTTGADSRAVQKAKRVRERVATDYAQSIERATTRRDGFTWLLDNNVATDNVIYYAHTGQWKFGWKSPLDSETVEYLLGLISEFPFPYVIQGFERTWEGY